MDEKKEEFKRPRAQHRPGLGHGPKISRSPLASLDQLETWCLAGLFLAIYELHYTYTLHLLKKRFLNDSMRETISEPSDKGALTRRCEQKKKKHVTLRLGVRTIFINSWNVSVTRNCRKKYSTSDKIFFAALITLRNSSTDLLSFLVSRNRD